MMNEQFATDLERDKFIESLKESLHQGKVERREFLAKLLALGFSAPAAYTLLGELGGEAKAQSSKIDECKLQDQTTAFAPAEPYCPRCGRNYVLQWENDSRAEKLSICIPCLMRALDWLGIPRNSYTIKDQLTER